MIKAIFTYTFLQNAVLGALLTSIVCGLIGTIIVEKKLVMMSGGIAHTSFGGIGLGYYLDIEPIFGALFFSVLASMGIASIKRNSRTGSDTLIGIFWAIGMALGILFISLTPGYPPDISSYLFGDILTITTLDLQVMLAATILICIVIVGLFNYWKAYLFDEEFLEVLGVNTKFLEYFLFILIGLTIVILIRLVGIILVIAMLTAPPATARLFTNDLKKLMFYASLLGIFFSMTGLWFSYNLNISSGAAIILLAGLSYFLSYFIKKLVKLD